jgi:hypothetical protein
MSKSPFPIKALCCALVFFLALVGQSVIAHNVDFDETHHAQHDCQSYQNISGDLTQPINLHCFSQLANEKNSFALADSSFPVTFIIRVRGPPSTL